MAKYVSNAFHALKVSFANEIGDVCAALGGDAQEVMRVFLMDRKLNVSEAYLRPGFAFGGSCLPKDVRALVHAANAADLSLPLLSSILPANEAQVRRGVEAVLGTRRRRVGVVGLAFKPGTDDLRESPMVTLVETLIGKGCDVRILDQSVAIARLVGGQPPLHRGRDSAHLGADVRRGGGADGPRRGARRRCRGRGGGARPRRRAARPGRDRPDAGRRPRPARRGDGVMSPV
jgi:GDP-mannose 6-dehydrogenase